MAGHIYRDGSVGLVLRVQELAREVQEREARLTVDLLAALPQAWQDSVAKQLAEMTAAIAPAAATPDELTTRVLTLVAYRDLLDAAVREATAHAHAARLPEGVLVTRVAFATRVVPDVPPLGLRGRRSSDGAAPDVASRFEALFVTTGEPAALALLTREVRGWLVSIARREAPVLRVEDGEARLTWNWDPDAAMFDAAVRVLHAIRSTPVPRGRG